MTKVVKKAASDTGQVVLSIDIGGSHVKILTSDGGTERRTDSGPDLTPRQMIDKVKKLADGLSYDVISMGYPGPVRQNKPVLDPRISARAGPASISPLSSASRSRWSMTR